MNKNTPVAHGLGIILSCLSVDAIAAPIIYNSVSRVAVAEVRQQVLYGDICDRESATNTSMSDWSGLIDVEANGPGATTCAGYAPTDGFAHVNWEGAALTIQGFSGSDTRSAYVSNPGALGATASVREEIKFSIDTETNVRITYFTDYIETGNASLSTFLNLLQCSSNYYYCAASNNNYYNFYMDTTIPGTQVATLTLPAGSYWWRSGAIATANQSFYDALSADASVSRSFSLTVVPLPAAVWLFGAGLLGLIGVARRKTV